MTLSSQGPRPAPRSPPEAPGEMQCYNTPVTGFVPSPSTGRVSRDRSILDRPAPSFTVNFLFCVTSFLSFALFLISLEVDRTNTM